MSELISGKEALSVVSDGVVQYRCADSSNPELWTTITDHYWGQYDLGVFLDEDTTWEFRLKPKTININGIEVPAPFEPEEDEDYFFIANGEKGYSSTYDCCPSFLFYGAWRTEEEIKQVVNALRSIFKKGL